MNPDDFVITRKRKKYKFAKFHNATNCFEFDQWQQQPVDVVELGAGSALFSVELAMRHPDKVFVAVDVKADRLQKGAYKSMELGLQNISFVRARADQMSQLFLTNSLEAIWLTFPDPFPKNRSSGRRMTHPSFLASYQALLRSGGRFYLKHDDRDFFCWSLEQLVSNRWCIDELTFDLHESNLEDDYKVMTAYETRWIGEGKSTNLVVARPSRASDR